MSKGYDRTAAPDINPDQELRQIFVAAVMHAFRPEKFSLMAYHADQSAAANQVFDKILEQHRGQPYFTRLHHARDCFTESLVNHWKNITLRADMEALCNEEDEIEGMRDIATNVANDTINCLRTQSARLEIVKS